MLLAGSRLAGSPSRISTTHLTAALNQAGFTGSIEATLEGRLGRRIDKKLANLGRLLWFDNAGGLHSDNTCGGCHSPTHGFGDTQSIAIGIQNNASSDKTALDRVISVGLQLRRIPPFTQTLCGMDDFLSASGDPFDNS